MPTTVTSRLRAEWISSQPRRVGSGQNVRQVVAEHRSRCEFLTFLHRKYVCRPSAARKMSLVWIDCVCRTGQWCTTHWLLHPIFAHRVQRGPLF